MWAEGLAEGKVKGLVSSKRYVRISVRKHCLSYVIVLVCFSSCARGDILLRCLFSCIENKMNESSHSDLLFCVIDVVLFCCSSCLIILLLLRFEK